MNEIFAANVSSCVIGGVVASDNHGPRLHKSMCWKIVARINTVRGF